MQVFLSFTFQGSPLSKVMTTSKNTYMIFYMCEIQTFYVKKDQTDQFVVQRFNFTVGWPMWICSENNANIHRISQNCPWATSMYMFTTQITAKFTVRRPFLIQLDYHLMCIKSPLDTGIVPPFTECWKKYPWIFCVHILYENYHKIYC